MLNDNILFPNYINMLPSRYYRSYNPYEHYDYDSSERDNILAELEQQEQNRRYQAALEEQAYLEALERMRQNKIAEERRRKQYRYLLELEQRRQEQEEEEKRRRQQQQQQQRQKYYLAHNFVQNQQRPKWRKERLRNEKAVALEELKRKEEEMRRKRLNPVTTTMNQTTIDPQMSRIIQGSDGNLYRVILDSSSPINSRRKNCNHGQSAARKVVDVTTDSNDDGKSSTSSPYVKPFHGKNHHEYSSSSTGTKKMDCFDDNNMTVEQLNDTRCSSDKNTKQTNYKRKKVVVPKKIVKSSILIGDVEDASDSECEDEYSDYMHTRRPQPGQWMEPIECMMR